MAGPREYHLTVQQAVVQTPEEQADTQKLLDMGIKIYSQQTPTFKVVPIDHT